MKSSSRIVAFFAAFGIIISQQNGLSNDFQITGMVSEVPLGLSSSFSVGEAFVMTISVGALLSDFGDTGGYNASGDFETGSYFGSFSSGSFLVLNDVPTLGDGISVGVQFSPEPNGMNAGAQFPSVDDFDFSRFSLDFADFTDVDANNDGAFTDISLPGTLDLTLFPDAFTRLSFRGRDGTPSEGLSSSVMFTLTSFEAVPEPAATVLASLGCLLLSTRRQR